MKTIMARNPHHDSLSFSQRYFPWKKKPTGDDDDGAGDGSAGLGEETLNLCKAEKPKQLPKNSGNSLTRVSARKLRFTITRLRSALSVGRAAARARHSSGLGTRVVGTLFGRRRGRVHLAFQVDFRQAPAFLVELATPTAALVREMVSGLVRVALECEGRAEKEKGPLLDEPSWRAYCNGKKCGYAGRKECGADEWKVLNAIGQISMGAGVLPRAANGAEHPDGDVMYMRARFERVLGSKDSEAFYMMNPDGNGVPELSIYLLRV